MADLKVRVVVAAIDRISKPMRQVSSSVAKVGGALDRTRSPSENLSRSFRNMGRLAVIQKESLSRLGRSLRSAETYTRALDRAQQKVSRTVDGLNRKFTQLKTKLAGMRGKGGGMGALGGLGLVGGAYGLARVLGGSMDLEEQEVRLNTVINVEGEGGAAAAVKRSVTHAREVARRTLASESELLEIQYELNSASLSESAARAGSVVASKVATVTKGDVGQVAKIMGGVFNNMGDSIEGSGVEEKLGRIGDVLTKTQFKFAISDFSQLGEGLEKASAGATANKLPLDQLAAAIGTLNNAQVYGSEAGTAMTAVLRQMSKASENLGFDIQRDADGSLNLGATLKELEKSLSVYDDLDERNQKIQELFGDEGKRGLIPLLKGLEKYEDGLQSILDANGLVDDSYQKFMDSQGGQWKMLVQNLSTVGTLIGKTVLPVLNTLLSPVAKLAAWLGKLIDRSPHLGMALSGVFLALGVALAGVIKYFGVSKIFFAVAGGIKAVGLAFLTFAAKGVVAAVVGIKAVGLAFLTFAAKGVVAAVVGIKAVGLAFLTFAAKGVVAAVVGLKALIVSTWAWTAALLANPITWVVVAVVAAAVLIYKYWEPISGFFLKLWDSIKVAAGAAWEWIKGIWNSAVEWFSGLSLADMGKALIETLVSGIKAAPGAVYAGLKAVLGPVGKLLPFSDAQEGPLARLTASGGSILGTLGEGVRRAGPGGLRRPLAQALGTAAVVATLTLPTAATGAVPAAESALPAGAAAGTIQNIDNSTLQIQIYQQPGEDAQALADRVLREIEARRQVRDRGALHDEL